MNKKILVGFVLIVLCFTLTGCETKENKVTIDDLNTINNAINDTTIEYILDNAQYYNLFSHYVDEENKVIVVELLDNSEEEQEWFRKNIIDSGFIKFVQGMPNSTPNYDEDVIGKTLVETYSVRNIENSNDENYLWLTLRKFQFEEVASVRVSRDLASKVKVNNNYEFTFKINSNNIDTNSILSIFNETELVKIEKTDKVGMEQTNGIIDN